jgi:hypothetical protein
MFNEQVEKATLADPHAQPLAKADFDRIKGLPVSKDYSPRDQSDSGGIC